MHALARGDAVDDAVLFRSEKCHNVARVRGGQGACAARSSSNCGARTPISRTDTAS